MLILSAPERTDNICVVFLAVFGKLLGKCSELLVRLLYIK